MSIKKAQRLVKQISGMLLVGEICRARQLLGVPTGQEQREQLLEMEPSQLIQEAQALGAAVLLSQQNDAAEHMRDAIAAGKGTRGPKTGPFTS